MSDSICWGLALSRAGAPVLERLDQGGLLKASGGTWRRGR